MDQAGIAAVLGKLDSEVFILTATDGALRSGRNGEDGGGRGYKGRRATRASIPSVRGEVGRRDRLLLSVRSPSSIEAPHLLRPLDCSVAPISNRRCALTF